MRGARIYGLRCNLCGAEFSRVASQLARVSHSFCSRQCFDHRIGWATPARSVHSFSRRYIEEPNSGCFLWLGQVNRSKPNYAQAVASYNGTVMAAAKVSWMLHHGPVPDGMCVCHRCDNPMCVNPDHLFLGTRRDNTQDMIRKGRQRSPFDTRRGEAHPRAKLNDDLVKKIRAAAGQPAMQISRDLGVSVHNVRSVLQFKVWRHVS